MQDEPLRGGWAHATAGSAGTARCLSGGDRAAAEDCCYEIRRRAERRTGELPQSMEKAKGTQDQLAGKDSSGGRCQDPAEIGISSAQIIMTDRAAPPRTSFI